MAKTLRDKLTAKVDFTSEEPEEHPIITRFTHKDGDFVMVKVDEVSPNPEQPRQHFDPEADKELTNSIKEKGVLQPVIIRVDKESKQIYLVAGERRLRASKKAGLDKIPAIVTTGDPGEIALIENIQREDLSPIDVAEASNNLMSKHKYTQAKLANVLGKSTASVSEILSLNKLPDKIKSECRQNKNYPRRLLYSIARQPNPEKMFALFKQYKDMGLTSDEVKKLASKKSQKQKLTVEDLFLAKAKGLYQSLKKLNLNEIQPDMRHPLERLKKLLEDILK
jgi:ParB family chromosome partitioning protein